MLQNEGYKVTTIIIWQDFQSAATLISYCGLTCY